MADKTVFFKPACYIYQEDDLSDVIRKALKTLKDYGIRSHKEDTYKELASQMLGRCKWAKDETHAYLIIRYYVELHII